PMEVLIMRCVNSRRLAFCLAAIIAAFFVSTLAVWADTPFVDGQLLVKPRGGDAQKLAAAHKALGAEVAHTFKNVGNLQLVHLPKGVSVAQAVDFYKKSGHAEYAEPDYIVSVVGNPDDPKFADGTLWAMRNTGQNGGTLD